LYIQYALPCHAVRRNRRRYVCSIPKQAEQ